MTTNDLMTMLRSRYTPPDWALIEEVRDGTGYATQGKRMDAMAFGLWPSRGLEVHGFELKVSRSDLLREIQNPAKAEDFYSYVDRWYLVVNDRALLKPGELPSTWGLIAPRGDSLAIITEAPKHKTKPLDRLFIAAIVRRLRANYILKNDFEEMIKKATADKIESAVSQVKYAHERALEQIKEYREVIVGFEKASGCVINKWNHGEIGAAVRVVMNHGPERILKQLDWCIRDTEKMLADMRRTRAGAVEELDKISITESASS